MKLILPEILKMEDFRQTCPSVPKFIESSLNIPNNAIFSGPPGCGKTFLARLIAGKLLNIEKAKLPTFLQLPKHENYYETNISDENGVAAAKDFIKNIERIISNRADDTPIIFVQEEAQGYTYEAKNALLHLFQRKDEQFKTVYFFQTTSEYDKLVDVKRLKNAYLRRFIQISFNPLTETRGIKYINEVAKLNSKPIPENIAKKIYSISGGSPGVINTEIEKYYIGGILQEDEKEEVHNNDTFMNFIISSAEKLSQETTISMITLSKNLDNLLEKNGGSWEKLRNSFNWYLLFTLKNDPKMDLDKVKVSEAFFRILKTPVIDTGIGSIDFHHRTMEMILAYKKIYYP